MAVQMDNLVNMFKQRQTMDGCGITATLGVNSDGQIVDVAVSSTKTCTMSLSGGAVVTAETVEMEEYGGVETTAWIDLTASHPQTFTLSSPISL